MSAGVPSSTAVPARRMPGSRLIGGVLIGALAAVPFQAGPALPAWIVRLGESTGVGGDHAARWLAAFLATTALLALLWPATASLALTLGGVALAFCGVATLAGGGSSVTLAVAAVALVVGIGCSTWLAGQVGPRPGGRRGASVAWHLLVSIALFGTLLNIAARIPVRATVPLITSRAFGPHNAAVPASAVQMINFELDQWEGRSLAETGLYSYLPQLTSLVGDGTVFIVFYNPRCSHCHELFEKHFAGHLDATVIAIEIPPAPGATLVESDEPTDITCPECQRLTLPTTHAWGVTPPAVVRVESGIVRCASEANALTGKNCIGVTTPVQSPSR